MSPQVRRVTLGLIVLWLALVVGVGGWMSQRAVASWLDRLFTQMASVTNMVASQAQVIQLAARYRTDPPGFDALTRQQRAAEFTRDPLVRKVGSFMDAMASDLQYGRIYLNNLSDDTVTASNWAEPGSIVGMIYSGRTYLVDALRHGNGHSFGIARLNRSPSYFVASRIDDADGAPLGAVTVKFDVPEMALYLAGRHIALIVNRQGRVTTASAEPFMLRNVAALLPPGTVRASKDGEEPGDPMDLRPMPGWDGASRWLIDGKPHLLQRRPLTNTEYHLLTLAPLSKLDPMRRRHVLTAALVAAFGLILILLSSHVAGQMVMRRQEERRAARQTAALNAELNVALTSVKDENRQKVEVLGYIGHDLRAPLATITGYSDLLLADAPENQHPLLRTIQRSVKYQMDLIDELLEYAKAELQPLAVQPVATDLPVLLDDISDYAIALCLQQNNRFHYVPSGRVPRQIALDGKRLQQVLLNLLSNAAKFTRDGAVTLTVRAVPEGATCMLYFSVSDTGVGMELKQDADIFSAFQQSANGSTGLGLFIAQRIVTAMGSSLRVSSDAGQGTTFFFALGAPVTQAPDVEWHPLVPREVHPDGPLPAIAVPREAMPGAQALDELASLALHGQFTDIEHWIERHAHEAAHAPFVARLRELLGALDFPGICALALHGRDHSRT